MNKKLQTWEHKVLLAEHYLALGHEDVYLHDTENGPSRPWELVTRCEPGGGHRLEIDTSVWFYAKHESGLTFRWTFDIEPSTANGRGSYCIDVSGCQSALARLPDGAKASFKAYLSECAEKVEAKGHEWQKIAVGQFGAAQALHEAAKS